MNMLKPYKFIQDIILHVLVNFNDLVNDELVQTQELEPLPIKIANSKPIKFEPLNNYLTHGNIIGTYVP